LREFALIGIAPALAMESLRTELKQPVKVVMTRQQIFQLLGLRPATSQRVRLGATRDGRMVALGHDVTMHTSPLAEFAEQTATSARPMYAAPNRVTRHRLTELDLPRGEDVRAPARRLACWRSSRPSTSWPWRWTWIPSRSAS
jgi:xanthine dehydrogenase YagR molybdenum-binding subunit